MDMSNTPTLVEFKEGIEWKRHQDDEGIILASNLGAFRAACDFTDCRAVILEVEDDKKNQDRAAFTSISEKRPSTSKVTELLLNCYYEASTGRLLNAERYSPPVLEGALEQSEELCKLMCDITGQQGASFIMMRNWKENADEHDPHDFSVLNRVFFSAGTILPINIGSVQVDEGNFLFMKPDCPHHPEKPENNTASEDRLTIVCH